MVNCEANTGKTYEWVAAVLARNDLWLINVDENLWMAQSTSSCRNILATLD